MLRCAPPLLLVGALGYSATFATAPATGAEIPPDVAESVRRNAEALSPITVKWRQPKSSTLSIHEWPRRVKLPAHAVDLFSPVEFKYCWQADAPVRDWFSYIHQSGPVEALVVIKSPYKLAVHGPGILTPDAETASKIELFEIDNDPNERANLGDQQRETVERMITTLRTFRSWKIDGVTAYGDGREGFTAPKDWIIPD